MPTIEAHLTDEEILREIGYRSKNRRLGRNMPVENLAGNTGMNRKTITNFEAGEDIRLSSLIKLLRGMNALGVLEAAFPDVLPGGEGINTRRQPRQRAYSSVGGRYGKATR